jgi:hypothetical protein
MTAAPRRNGSPLRPTTAPTTPPPGPPRRQFGIGTSGATGAPGEACPRPGLPAGADGPRLHPRSPARPVECSNAGRWSSTLDAARRQVAAPSSGSAAPFRSGGGIGCAAPIVAAPNSPRGARQDGSHCAQLGQRGAFQNSGANGSAAPFRTAAELAERGHGAPVQLGPVVRARTAAIAPSSGSAAPFRTAARMAARRLSERRRNWLSAAMVRRSSSAPWCAPGRRPSPRSAWAARLSFGMAAGLAAQRLSERRRNWLRGAPSEWRREWQRGAIVAAPARSPVVRASDSSSSGRWRPRRTAPARAGGAQGRQPWSPRPARPRWCARRTAPARPRGVRQDGSHRRRVQLGPGGARARWTAPARPRGAHVGQLQLGPVARPACPTPAGSTGPALSDARVLPVRCARHRAQQAILDTRAVPGPAPPVRQFPLFPVHANAFPLILKNDLFGS